MSRYATETGGGGGGFKPSIGIHNAVCCQLVDFGTHEKEWQGKIVGKVNKINLGFEFVDVNLESEDGGTYHPVWGVQMTNSLGKRANLRTLLEGWRGREFTDEELKGFDLDKLLGLSCQLVIQPNTKGNPKIAAIAKAPAKYEGKRDLRSFWFDDEFDGNLPDWIPEWMQEIIHESDEFLGLNEQDSGSEDPESDQAEEEDDCIPF